MRTAHGGGLKIAAHCIGFEASRQAVEAGIDSIEHGTHLEEDTARLMALQGTYLVPTLSTWDIRERMDSQDGASRDQVTDNLERKENSLASFKRAMEAGVKNSHRHRRRGDRRCATVSLPGR